MARILENLNNGLFPNSRNSFKPSILKPKNLFVLAIILIVVKFLIFSWSLYFPRTNYFAIVVSSDLIEFTNQERVKAGLSPLSINQKLILAAQKKAQDMIDKGYFAHTSPDGLSPWYWLDETGYKYVAAGENLAKDFTDSNYLHNAWMNSSSHKANILNKNYQEIGIAVIEGEVGGKKTTIAVEFFGKSPSLTSKVATIEKKEVKPITISETKIELLSVADQPETKLVKGEEISFLQGPNVFRQRSIIESVQIESKGLFLKIIDNSESFIRRTYFMILGILVLILALTIFINIRVQYPKLIFTAIIFIIFIFGIAVFNGQAFLNKGLEIL
jgi:hypothetical protein